MISAIKKRKKEKRNTIDMVEYPDIYPIIHVEVEGLLVNRHLSMDVFKFMSESMRKMMFWS